MSENDHKREIADMISCYLQGDEEAFEKLYYRTEDDLRKYCYFRFEGLNAKQVEDILQTTYLKISKNLKGLKNPENFLAWAYQIVRTTGIDYLRKEQKYVYTQDDDIDDWASRIPDDSESSFPEEQIFASEVRGVIIRSLKTLSRNTKETFCLFYFDHMKNEEIAKAQCIRPGTVKSRLHSAREKLKRELLSFRNIR